MKNKSLLHGTAMPFIAVLFFIFLLGFISCRKKTGMEQQVQHPSSNNRDPNLPGTPYQYAVGGNDNLVTLGRVLFYDKNLSGDRSVSCGSCHKQSYGFADNSKFSIGAGGLSTPRNTHPITKMINSHFWDGKNQLIFNDTLNSCLASGGYSGTDTLICTGTVISTTIFKNPVTIPFLTSSEMNMKMEDLGQRLSQLPYYSKLFSQAFPADPTPINEKNIQAALGIFLDNIIPNNTRFSQVIAAGGTGFSPEEMDGWNIFNGKGKCNLCHKANNAFAGSPGQFEDIGLNLFYNDEGRKDISGNSVDAGRFHIPSLMNVEVTGPYMHDGRFRSLEEVVEFFSSGVQNSPNVSSAFAATPIINTTGDFVPGILPVQQLNLSITEKANLVAFLKTLTDHSLLTDVRFSDPFKK